MELCNTNVTPQKVQCVTQLNIIVDEAQYFVIMELHQMNNGAQSIELYLMWLDSANWTLSVRFDGWYWYQYFFDGSNIWGVDRTEPWGPKMDQPPAIW